MIEHRFGSSIKEKPKSDQWIHDYKLISSKIEQSQNPQDNSPGLKVDILSRFLELNETGS